MDSKLNNLFVNSEISDSIDRAIKDFGMLDFLYRGTLVGLSGGADSVMLLLYLVYLRKKCFFPLLAVHINHGIRIDEADRDEEFSRELCEKLGVEFKAVRINVPKLAKEYGKGLEEAARDARYNAFSEIISGRNDIFTVAVAHNADDNFETVIMNMLRGAGARGLSGIMPVRDNIVRPLIYLSKSDILKALQENEISFVHDSTNDSVDYTRNYIRHKIMPAFDTLAHDAKKSIIKTCRNLREDEDCLSSMATDFFNRYQNGKIPRTELLSLHPSVRFRALKLYTDAELRSTLERVHFDAISSCLESSTDFTIALTRGFFVACDGFCGVYREMPAQKAQYEFKLNYGENRIDELGITVEISNNKNDFSKNVNNKSTQAVLTSAIIIGDLFIRSKLDGDKYFYGGITHKLKKLFNDKKIPLSLRSRIPVLCDESGVVWVPGFGVRDDGGKNNLFIRISADNENSNSLYLPDFLGKEK